MAPESERPVTWEPRKHETEPDRCTSVCRTCLKRCIRGTGDPEHVRHYHPEVARGCSNAEAEKDGYALERAAQGDWGAWLVPGPLPAGWRQVADDTPILPRQVWVCKSRNSAAAAVVRIMDYGLPVVLARQDVPGVDNGFFMSAPYGHHAMLVQQAGAPQPTLPSVLWGDPPKQIRAEDVKDLFAVDRVHIPEDDLPGEDVAGLGATEDMVMAAAQWSDRMLAEAIKTRLMRPKGDLALDPEYGLSISDLAKAGQQYSGARVSIEFDGKPLKLDGIKSIDYSPRQPIGRALRASDYEGTVEIVVDPWLPVDSWFLRAFPPKSLEKLIVPPELRYGPISAGYSLPHIALPDREPYEAPKLTRIDSRAEVSADGRSWVAYEMLVDADPFEKWSWRRLVMPNGEVQLLAKPVVREETQAWAEHVQQDQAIGHHQRAVDRFMPKSSMPHINGHVAPGFGREPSCRPILAGGIIGLRRG